MTLHSLVMLQIIVPYSPSKLHVQSGMWMVVLACQVTYSSLGSQICRLTI